MAADGVQRGLHNGARVAIIGGGVCGSAMAAALLLTARTRGRNVFVHVFEGGAEEPVGTPVVLSAECRSRLAALGCKVAPSWRSVELAGIDVAHGSVVERIDCPPGGIWVVDGGGPDSLSGRRVLSNALAAVAALQGATFHPRAAERVEADHCVQGSPNGAAPYIVRACGRADRFDAVVNASGANGTLGASFFDGFDPAPALPAAHARLTIGSLEQLQPSMRIVLKPVPGMDALYLVPCKDGIYALGYGPTTTPAELCQALMTCARDGHLPEGFDVAALAPTRIPAGVSGHFIEDGRLAVGTAAFGHPFQLTISAALASCSRAAVALMECEPRRHPLKKRYVREGIQDLLADAKASVRANFWLRHAGGEAVRAFTRGQTEDRFNTPWTTGILGLAAPTARGVLARARSYALFEWLGRLWYSQAPVLPAPKLELGRPLFYVVDDDSSVRDSLYEYLEARGAEVVCFSDELALYCAVAKRPPTAIVLDVVLRWVDGLSLLGGLKRHPLTRDTRVIVMSGINRPFVRNRALEGGAEAFFAKPVNPEVLWRRLTGAVPLSVEAPKQAEPLVESGRYAS